jgi:hypothetical protein
MGSSGIAMSSVIEQVRERLSKYPDARIEYDAFSISVVPGSPGGFTVRLTVHSCGAGEHYTIWYNGSHEEILHDPKTAINLFAFGLSTGCRLQEYSRAGRAYRWVVEAWSPQRQRWEADWDVVRWLVALFLFWQRPTVRCLQNRLIDLDAADSPSRQRHCDRI